MIVADGCGAKPSNKVKISITVTIVEVASFSFDELPGESQRFKSIHKIWIDTLSVLLQRQFELIGYAG